MNREDNPIIGAIQLLTRSEALDLADQLFVAVGEIDKGSMESEFWYQLDRDQVRVMVVK